MNELRRLHRGLVCLREAFGWQFTAVILAVAVLLVVAVLTIHGAFAGVGALVLVLLAIRAHDLGEDALPPIPRETLDDAMQAHQDRTIDPEERRAAAAAQVEFLKRRHQVALGWSHEPKEL